MSRGRAPAIAVALALTLALVAPSARPAAAAEPEFEGRIAHIRVNSDGWSYELVVAQLGGRSRIVPLNRPALSRPAISPDGSRIAFISPVTDGTDGRFGLFVANLDGTSIRRLTSSLSADFDPAWSPDGTRIAVSRDTSGSLNPETCCVIRVVEVDGTGSFTVPGTRGGTNPAWSPDGREIAYERPEGITITTLDGSESRRITGAGGGQPGWSPDGTAIVYVAPIATGWELVTRRPNGGGRIVRLTSSLTLESPTFAPDSETIYYVRYAGEGYDGRTRAVLWRHHPATGAKAVYADPAAPMILASLSLLPAEAPTCDTDADDRAELVVGAPSDDDSVIDGGVVTVVAGVSSGIGGGRQWHANIPGVAGTAGRGDEFGAAVACGDFNGDGFAELAIGAPGDGSGSVTVLAGGETGTTASGSQLWTQDTGGVLGSGRAGDRWGAALATGDFNGDGRDDLAVGAPGNDGSVTVLFGSAGGLTATGNQRWTAVDFGLAALPAGRFGASVASGDLDGDGFDDLIAGSPGFRVDGEDAAGAVAVAGGSAQGPSAAATRSWTQESPGIAGIAHAGDELGAAVASGDLDGDGFDDLVAGAPGSGHGGINVMYGSSRGESGAGDQVWKRNTPGILGIGRGTDRFGTSVAVGDLDGDGFDDVAVGVPGTGPGAVNVIYGSRDGLVVAGNQLWKQNTPGVVGVAHAGDAFGTAVSISDLNGDGYDDLAVGAPGNGPGAVNVLFGSPGTGATARNDVIVKQGRGGVPGTPTGRDGHGAAVR